MENRLEQAYKENVRCLVCEQDEYRVLGIRGNREFTGADPNTVPHLYTDVVECLKCGFIYTNPQIKGVEFLEKDHYNDPDEYQAEGSEALSEMYVDRVEYIKRFQSKGTLLDVGAGKGDFVKIAMDSGFEACGIEPSPKFSEFARNVNGVQVFEGNLDSSKELQESKFDVITLHHVLEHVESPHSVLEDLKAHLNDDGVIYIEVPNTQSLTSKTIDIYFRLRGLNWSCRLSPLHPPFHKYGYNPKSLQYLLEKHEFKILASTTFSAFSRGFGNRSSNPVLNISRNLVVSMVDLLGNRDMLAFVVTK